jgi:hypothetical protein
VTSVTLHKILMLIRRTLNKARTTTPFMVLWSLHALARCCPALLLPDSQFPFPFYNLRSSHIHLPSQRIISEGVRPCEIERERERVVAKRISFFAALGKIMMDNASVARNVRHARGGRRGGLAKSVKLSRLTFSARVKGQDKDEENACRALTD